MATRREHQWLRGELPNWVAAGLVSAENADKILVRYPQAEGSNFAGRTILSTIGAILFGLGIILIFAYNWAEMHRYVKLSVIFGFLVTANLAALWFDGKGRKTAGEGMAILGTMLFGAGIWLTSQIYHINEHYPNAFWLWGVAALLMAWARQSAAQCLAALVLLFSWGCMESFQFDVNFHQSPWWLLLGCAPLAWRLRSPQLLFLALGGFFVLWLFPLFDELRDVAGFVLLAVAITLIQLPQLLQGSKVAANWPLQKALSLPGFAIYFGLLFALTFVHSISRQEALALFDSTLKTAFFWGAHITVFAVLLASFMAIGKRNTQEVLHTLLITAAALLAFLAGPDWIHLPYGVVSGIANLVLLAHALLFIWHGSAEQNGREVASGCLLVASLAFARYTDLFESLLSRSLVFLILGAALFLVGNFYSRQKKAGGKP